MSIDHSRDCMHRVIVACASSENDAPLPVRRPSSVHTRLPSGSAAGSDPFAHKQQCVLLKTASALRRILCVSRRPLMCLWFGSVSGALSMLSGQLARRPRWAAGSSEQQRWRLVCAQLCDPSRRRTCAMFGPVKFRRRSMKHLSERSSKKRELRDKRCDKYAS
jgi:hypothetical protein